MRCLPLMVLALLLTACSPPPSDELHATASVRPARIFQVTARGDTEHYQFVGRVEAAQTVDMSFQVPGMLIALPVREGQEVAAGEFIAAIDPTDYELALREAEAQLQLARQDYERKRQLLRQQVMAQSEVDDARTLVQLREVRVERAREDLADTRLYAPFDAVVARRFTDNHVNIVPGTPVVRLHDRRELHVRANVPEDLLATADGDRVVSIDARFDFAGDRRFPLQIHENTGEADSVAQTYAITFSMAPVEDFNILPGMTATVEVVLRAPVGGSAVVIPTNALVSDAERNFHVWLYDPATGSVHKRVVEVGTPAGSGIPVLAGLGDGDLIVATGATALQEGMRVRPLGDPVTHL